MKHVQILSNVVAVTVDPVGTVQHGGAVAWDDTGEIVAVGLSDEV